MTAPERPEPRPAGAAGHAAEGADPGRDAGARRPAAKALAAAPERRRAVRDDVGHRGRATSTRPRTRAGLDEDRDLGRPGEYPFTRGVQPTMYRGRFWTMRQYAGFATAEETNQRFRYLLEQGQTGLSVAFDLPTQMGYDSDAPEADGEVGRVGVPDREPRRHGDLFDGMPLGEVSDLDDHQRHGADPAGVLRGRRRAPGRPAGRVCGHRPERHPQGVHRPRDVHLPAPARRCGWSRTSSSSAPASCRAGTRSRSAATTCARRGRRPPRSWRSRWPTAIAYVEAAVARGLDVDDFAGRLSFFFAAWRELFEEVAKFRAARRMWARIMQRAVRRAERRGR